MPGEPATFRTTDTVIVETRRPGYWNSPSAGTRSPVRETRRRPDRSTAAVAGCPGRIRRHHWSPRALDEREATRTDWTLPMRRAGRRNRARSLRRALPASARPAAAPRRPRAPASFPADESRHLTQRYRVAATTAGARSRSASCCSHCRSCAVPGHEANVVDTVWFATGGGKTETYLGLLVTAALHDRLTGKQPGSRPGRGSPADAQPAADPAVRRRAGRRRASAARGAHRRRSDQPRLLRRRQPGTPNRINVEARDGEPDPEDESMPARYQVLLACPFCRRKDIRMRMDRRPGGWHMNARMTTARGQSGPCRSTSSMTRSTGSFLR